MKKYTIATYTLLILLVAGEVALAETAKIELTKQIVKDTGLSIEEFALDVGRPPTLSEGLDALWSNKEGIPGWHGPYLTSKFVRKDAWGKPLIYKPGVRTGSGFEVCSVGSDERDDGRGEHKICYP